MADHVAGGRDDDAVVRHRAEGGDLEGGGMRADGELDDVAGRVELAEDLANVLRDDDQLGRHLVLAEAEVHVLLRLPENQRGIVFARKRQIRRNYHWSVNDWSRQL